MDKLRKLIESYLPKQGDKPAAPEEPKVKDQDQIDLEAEGDSSEEPTDETSAKEEQSTTDPKVKPRTSSSDAKAMEQAQAFARGIIGIKDIIAPSGIEVDFNNIQLGSTVYRTYFIAGYPREVGPNWLAPIINFPHALDISMFYYPIDAQEVLKNLRRKITEMQTELNIEYKEGRILDPEVQLALQDAKGLQDELVSERERFFQFALYITLPAEDKKELVLTAKKLESTLASILLMGRKATLQMEDGFKSTLPIHDDKLKVYRNMDTTSIATTFPFTSSSLTSDEGVMYGINEHNGSLIVFDRFNMENANAVIFGKSGSGKSYTVKLEAIRNLLLGTEIMVIDPENEFQQLSGTIGGEYITYDFSSTARINPFDLSQVNESGENQLESKILVLHSLMKVMLGEVTPKDEAILDQALLETYRLKGISDDQATHKKEPPLLEDLYKVLQGMEDEGASGIASQLDKYVRGSAKGLFDKPTNVDIKNTFTVFGIRDLEESVRPIGMFLILDYIWTRIRRDRRRRLLYVDEAWIMMKNEGSANFMHSIAKRARKYYLGLTTISQDIEDFLGSEKGLSIVTNSSIQILMKQSATAIDRLAEVFYLSEGEQNLLLSANVGEGLFFAGQSHVAMQVVASNKEHGLITTNPKELEMMEKMRGRVDTEDKLSALQTEGQTTQDVETPDYYEEQQDTSMLARRVGTKNAGAAAQAENASIDDRDLDGEVDTEESSDNSETSNDASAVNTDNGDSEESSEENKSSEDRFAAISAQFEQAAEEAKDDLVEQFGEDAVGEDEK